MTEMAEAPPDVLPDALGLVLAESDMAFALIHQESLVACAAWALGAAGVVLVDATVPWSALVETGEPIVLHDAFCPMTPPGFIAACVRRSVSAGTSVAGVRPVTDTVKEIRIDGTDHILGATIDRTRLWSVASPVVLTRGAVAGLSAQPTDLVDLVRTLGRAVVPVEAPPEARRVTTRDEIRVLEALTTR